MVALSPSASVFYASCYFFRQIFFVARRGRGNVLKREGAATAAQKCAARRELSGQITEGGRAMMPVRPDEDPKKLAGRKRAGFTKTIEKANSISS